ncbi:MAG: iron transporter [Candidatus Levybacteria bacterium RIFCSPHIGHO2_02_FULL_40_18]|nr:MAG: iron transporter [Candidatus Levybacteria bacterium RIFCSPHIGHO2_01_FULL_40_58]OGH26453.1 MAG: iron transporter [Candidatus Levybacteria bacterium RIFCSPHIGHO2_02_FULL_40_18]OGH31901.1 MAG: iron transporter [Candidatus Levybacteria bacterium RIFCSPHIGHO2_12_FULL_40_31]OGH40170.1 MAG: iron transporter [Candidatus Levybacteria bacterium RIFCSPLOWO2_01_FULL_40_64]OGH49294.1 MAG: iron transporter [Candidatus Levybacteria bacterium RIFCSPLOWO2_02_FULL_41_11]OGH53879.1 MAG: iron transporter 
MLKKLKKLLSLLGPGFITGASDDDPSGIATYAQTGAQFGYSQLWTAPFSFPFMTAIQEMCGRIGLVTGKGLSGVIKKYYSRPVLYIAVLILFTANTVNIGANLGAMASAAGLLFDIPFIFWLVGMTVLTLILEVFVSYKLYSKYLKYLAFSLFAYVLVVFVVRQNWEQIIASTIVPSFALSGSYLLNIVAILGTTISPYLFFWQETEEVEEEVEKGKIMGIGRGIPKVLKRDIRIMRIDTVIGMFFSNLVMFFIIATVASTLYASGIHNINTADQVAEALRPLAGDFAYLLFAAGIIGTGLLSVPILAGSASYALAEALGWREGLYRKLKQAHGFYGAITIATLIGLLVNFLHIPPFQMLYYTAVLNGIAAPPLIILILLISNNKKIMGGRTNSTLSNALGITITAVMSFAALALLFDLIF